VRARFLPLLHPPLIEAVQVPDDAFGEHFVLMQRDECAEPRVGVRRSRSRVLEGGCRGGPLCGAPGGGAEGKGCALGERIRYERVLPGRTAPVSSITMKSTGLRWVPWCSSW